MTPVDLPLSAAAKRPRAATLVVFGLFVALLLWRFSVAGEAARSGTAAAPRVVEPRAELEAEERRTIDLFRRAAPAVVNITNVALARGFWDMPDTEIPQGTGTGFVWDARGHIVTNFHVIANGKRFHVMLADGEKLDAELVAEAPDQDIAVLRLSTRRDDLVPIAVGRSADLQVGQKVLAIGSPFGLDQTLTTGIISGLGREIRSLTGRRITDVIQTDASINPGNSGGPLLDSSGRLIGMNTAIVSSSGSSAGIGFAVPVDTINRVVPELIEGRSPARAGLGIEALTDRGTRMLRERGVVVRNVIPGGAADRAGIRGWREEGGDLHYDVIVAVGDQPIQSFGDLRDALDPFQPGDEVSVAVRREGKLQKLKLRLQALESETR